MSAGRLFNPKGASTQNSRVLGVLGDKNHSTYDMGVSENKGP